MRTFDFTESLTEFQARLSEQSAAGGGDYPEAMHLAMEHAGKLSWRDGNAARVLFLIGDAPPHDAMAQNTLDAMNDLRRRGVRIYPLGASGVAPKAEFVMRAGAFLTLGQYLFLTDHSGVGNPHAEPHVPEYQVERLDRMMIRMIASELAGKRLVPQEVIAIEKGSSPNSSSTENQPWETDQSWNGRPVSRNTTTLNCRLLDLPIDLPTATVIQPWLLFIGILVAALFFDALCGRFSP